VNKYNKDIIFLVHFLIIGLSICKLISYSFGYSP
jgi:hypothetical protein